jgi:hypothetical protein
MFTAMIAGRVTLVMACLRLRRLPTKTRSLLRRLFWRIREYLGGQRRMSAVAFRRSAAYRIHHTLDPVQYAIDEHRGIRCAVFFRDLNGLVDAHTGRNLGSI